MEGKIMLIASLALFSIIYCVEEGTIQCGPYTCQKNQSCENQHCINPCESAFLPCGDNADCTVLNHVRVCACQPLYTGNPYISCRSIDSDD